MDYKLLQAFASELLDFAYHQNIPYKLYWYSPDSRKVNPNNKIGYYDNQPSSITLAHGCKLVITFPRLAFDSLQSIINARIPLANQINARENYRSDEEVGFDVYQRVHQLKLFIEAENKSSKEFTVNGMMKKGSYWAGQQLKALEERLPPLSQQQIDQSMKEVAIHFKQALAYLQAQSNPQAKLRVRRESGFRHRIIRVNLAGDQTKREGFSDLVLVFGTGRDLPKVDLPKPSNPTRKPRSDSVSARYKANPSSFKYYDKFGIFEVYDE